MSILLEKLERCPRCREDPKIVEEPALWNYDSQTCGLCGYSRLAPLVRAQPKGIPDILLPFVNGFTEDPSTADLYNEQPISVRVTLGDWRALRRLLRELAP